MEAKKEYFKEILSTYNKTNLKKIGTLSEKTLHAIFKKYLCHDETYHEVKVGSYYADICFNSHIIEIQTRQFNKLRTKLEYYLQEHEVTICYPIIQTKYLVWIDTLTGELTEKRKSPKTGKVTDAFFELYKIKMFLNNPNLHLKFIIINALEYRNLNGWSKNKKRGSSRYEMIPTELIDEVEINSKDDYLSFVEGMNDEFTNQELAKKLKINIRYAALITNILVSLELLEVVGKKDRKNIYKIKKEDKIH